MKILQVSQKVISFHQASWVLYYYTFLGYLNIYIYIKLRRSCFHKSIKIYIYITVYCMYYDVSLSLASMKRAF